MPYEIIIRDINQTNSRRVIGTDKGLAQIGDSIVNLAYSMAKSIYLTKKNSNKPVRKGIKVSKKILSLALKNAEMKNFARSRADAHDLADTVEAIIAFIWLNNKMTIQEIIDFLESNLSGDLQNRANEIKAATEAFTNLLIYIKKFLPSD